MRHGVGRDLERRVLRQGGAGEGEGQGGSDRRPRQAGGQGKDHGGPVVRVARRVQAVAAWAARTSA